MSARKGKSRAATARAAARREQEKARRAAEKRREAREKARRAAERLARKRAAEELARKRAAAARRGWETRRREEKRLAAERERQARAERARKGWEKRRRKEKARAEVAKGPSPLFREEWEDLGGDLGRGVRGWVADTFFLAHPDADEALLSAEQATREAIRGERAAWVAVGVMVSDEGIADPSVYVRVRGMATIWTGTYRSANVGGAFVAAAAILRARGDANVEGFVVRVAWSEKKPSWR